MVRLLAILVSLPIVAHAGTCPPYAGDETRRQDLMRAVKEADDAGTARHLTNQLWEIWADAPDAHAQDLLDEGIDRRVAFDLDNALAAFDALIDYCPEYAEGYNQRAFVLFIRQDFTTALDALDRALDLSPEHLGALTGRAMAYMALGRDAEALLDLEKALALNPWLKERDLLPVLRGRLGAEDI
ncbi:tetratricopeptide repeat protein [Tropicimonas marinistellae]|uniref:tetratricopeptide repeat protein n=1 Tax=Tropicimonas marinistellae TaxID=1739787 RepID=UPI00098FD611|nr:tetratricopeptide repeat protein [Tropicimonas marinistellae]